MTQRKALKDKLVLRGLNRVERFISYIKTARSGCWEWQANTSDRGYGEFGRWCGDKSRAHRYAYLLFNGVDPGPGFVCHACDNPGCVNPKHLFLADHVANMADMVGKRRAAAGERHARARLSNKDVGRIRARLKAGATATELAREYGVCKSTVSHIKTGRNWSKVHV